VGQGNPEEIAALPNSLTGQFLKAKLAQPSQSVSV